MKKSAKIFAGIFLAVLFAVVLAVFVRPYFLNNKNEEMTEGQIAVKAPKQIYEIGEDMEVEGLVFNVSEAELLEDYEKIDSYYKERGFVQSREDYVKTYIEAYRDKDFFAGDIRFFRIKCFMTNNTGKAAELYLDSLYPTSIVGSGIVPWYFKCYDGKGISDNAKEKELSLKGKRKTLWIDNSDKGESYVLQPEESIEIEVVGEFCLLDIYSAYTTKESDGRNRSYDLYLMRDNSTKRIHLNITGSFDDKNSIYLNTRNIPKMKSESWTNLEQKTWSQEFRQRGEKYGYSYSAESYPSDMAKRQVIEVEEPGQKFLELWNKRWTDGRIEAAFSLETTLTNYEIIEWNNLPSDFAEQENLQRMAQRYYDVYNCQEEDLKVLILDLSYASSQIGELISDEREIINYFYERSKLYVKEKVDKPEEKEVLRLFGTADDWIVTENSAHPENIGAVNLDNMELYADISVRMAYILPPQLYESYSALYFTGGSSKVAYDEDNIPRTKIVL